MATQIRRVAREKITEETVINVGDVLVASAREYGINYNRFFLVVDVQTSYKSHNALNTLYLVLTQKSFSDTSLVERSIMLSQSVIDNEIYAKVKSPEFARNKAEEYKANWCTSWDAEQTVRPDTVHEIARKDDVFNILSIALGWPEVGVRTQTVAIKYRGHTVTTVVKSIGRRAGATFLLDTKYLMPKHFRVVMEDNGTPIGMNLTQAFELVFTIIEKTLEGGAANA